MRPTFQQRNPIAGVAVLVCVRRYPLECSPVNHATPRLASTAVIGMAPFWRGTVSISGGNQRSHVESCRRCCQASVRSVTDL
jgi:hypothetical protein